MKRLLVFLVLLAGGFVLLQQLVDEDLFASRAKAGASDSEPEPPMSTGGTNLGAEQGTFGAKLEQRGELKFPRYRDIPQPDGSILQETIFVLHAKDSQPLRSGLQQLDDVEVTLFRHDEPTAVVRAGRALVELGTDANGAPSLIADKEIFLTGVVLEALPGSRAEGLRLELERANVLVDDIELQVNTPAADDPVKLTFAGKRSVTLEGRGLQARLPRDRSGALQRIDVHILSMPFVTTDGVTARSRGRLHYAEDMASMTGRLSLEEEIVITVTRGATPARGPVTVTGDQLLAWIVRHAKSGGGERGDLAASEATWRMLQLDGAPATIKVEQFALATPRLTLLPGMSGSPFWITASGGLSTVEGVASTRRSSEPTPVRGRSPRRIHLWRPAEHLGAVHRAFGFPQWALAAVEGTHVVAFAGDAHLEDDARTIDSSRGMRIYHLDGIGRAVLARGFGGVELEQRSKTGSEALHATGSDGFFLESGPRRDIVDLGPPATERGWRAHRYELRHGELRAHGAGACRIERRGERSVIELLAGEGGIEASFARRGATLADTRWLRAVFEGEDLRAFELAGAPAVATMTYGEQKITATAPRIAQTGRASLRMLPPDPAHPEFWQGLNREDLLPRLRREVPRAAGRPAQLVDTTAPSIEVHYLGRSGVLVDARAEGGVPAHVEATISEAAEAPPVVVTMDAARLRALPYAISPLAARFHAGGDDTLALLPFAPWLDAWILGDEVRHARVTGSAQGTFEGAAHRMVLSAGARAGLLIGDPATMTPAWATQVGEERRVSARGALVRLGGEEDIGLRAFRAFPGHSTFLLPEVELHSLGGDGELDHMRATCQGDIEIRPAAVHFYGPVTARGIAPDGSLLPDGIGIVAQQLAMERYMEPHEDAGRVRRVTGRDVDFAWQQVSGHGAELDLDLVWHTVDVRGGARVEMASGLAITGEQVKVDYQTLAYQYHKGHAAPLSGTASSNRGAAGR